MPHVSQPFPLQFWSTLYARMERDYEMQLGQLAEALEPMTATVDTADLVLARTRETRGEVFTRLKELENAQLLFMILKGQLRNAESAAGIHEAETHILCLRNMAALFEGSLAGAARRNHVEQDLLAAVAQYNGLRSAGNGEPATSERQRLRALTFELPVVGTEDIREQERAQRALQSNIDKLDAELQTLKVTTTMTLRVPDDLATLLESFGVSMLREPVLEEPAPMGEQVDANA